MQQPYFLLWLANTLDTESEFNTLPVLKGKHENLKGAPKVNMKTWLTAQGIIQLFSSWYEAEEGTT